MSYPDKSHEITNAELQDIRRDAEHLKDLADAGKQDEADREFDNIVSLIETVAER